MATKPAGESAYGATSMSSNPGGRNKTRSFDTSVGAVATTVAENATVNACAAAQDAVLKAQRAVARRQIGLGRSVESGGAVLGLEIVAGGSGYSNTTNTAATGGNGTGLTINITQTAGVVTAVAVGNNAGKGYTVGDLVSENTVAGSGLSVRITSVS